MATPLRRRRGQRSPDAACSPRPQVANVRARGVRHAAVRQVGGRTAHTDHVDGRNAGFSRAVGWSVDRRAAAIYRIVAGAVRAIVDELGITLNLPFALSLVMVSVIPRATVVDPDRNRLTYCCAAGGEAPRTRRDVPVIAGLVDWHQAGGGGREKCASELPAWPVGDTLLSVGPDGPPHKSHRPPPQ
jgi:hypothetical protein